MTTIRNLLDDDAVKLEVIRLNNDGLSTRAIQDITGVNRTSVGKFINRKTYVDWWGQENDKPVAAGSIYDHHKHIQRLNKTTYICVSAQNNTFVHRDFLKSLEVLKSRYDAQILVGTFSYNKSGFQNLEKSEGEWFDPLIKPYILDEPAILADGLFWCGELNILPTAVNPLSGFHSYTKSNSGIIPHAKMQLESLPRNKDEDPRFLYTTGSVTQRNYIQKKAGQKASFHHIFGALIVEVDKDGTWFVRQLNADSKTGCFYDLDTYYTPQGYSTNHRVEGINWGDIHKEIEDKEVFDISFGSRPDSLLNWLRPKYQFMNDVIHFEARNHHNIKDPHFRFASYIHGRDSVEDNIREVAEFLNYVSRDYCNTVVVESNHDQAMKRWLKEADYKSDPVNAVYFLENQLDLYRAIQSGKKIYSVFANAVKKFFGTSNDITFLREDESFKIANDIECGSHGHRGINGARGSTGSFCKLGIRINLGHTHTAAIKDGVYCAGVSGKLDQSYNVGPTTWSHSHIITYPDGKRTIVTIKNGKHSVSRHNKKQSREIKWLFSTKKTCQ